MNRRSGVYRSRGTGIGISAFLFAIVLAVSIGYVGTKYVIYPFLLQDKTAVPKTAQNEKSTEAKSNGAEEWKSTEEKKTEETKSIIEDKQKVEVLNVYSLQFGTYSDKESANIKVKELSANGINAYIYEGVGEYKVFGNSYASKERAQSAMTFISNGGIEAVLSESNYT